MPNDTMNFGVDLLPITSETYNLGSSTKKWNIFGDVTGNATNVTGTVAISNGGTGLSSADPHKVLIGPASGSSAAAPTWRILADEDIPTSLTLASITNTDVMTITTTVKNKTITVESASTLYLTSGKVASSSIIFSQGTSATEIARFNTSGNFVPVSGSTNTIGTSSLPWTNIYATTFTGDLSGNASSASALTNLCASSSARLSNANITHVTNGGVVHYKIGSGATNGPISDGNILHFYWDTSSNWDAQLYIPDGNQPMQYRGHTSSTVWTDWKTLLSNENGWMLYGGTIVPNGTNLNSLNTIGNYYQSAIAQTSTMTNLPNGKNAFNLKVWCSLGGNSAYLKQTLRYYNKAEVYTRWSSDTGNNWSDWRVDLTSDNYSSYALPLSGGEMTGPLTWKNATALPATTSTSYFLTIDAFADGGTTKYISAANALTSLGALPLTGGALTGNVTNTGVIISYGSSGIYSTSASDGPSFYFLRNNNLRTENKLGSIFMNISTTNSISRPDRMYFRQYTYDASTGAISEKWDQYRLPAATTGLSSSKTYEIITTKNLTDITSVGTITTATTLTYANGTAANYPFTIIRGNSAGSPRTGGLSIWKVGDATTSYSAAWLYIDTVGVANTAGMARFTIGNGTASTADGNYCGKIRIYGSGTGYSDITGTAGTLGGSSRTYLTMGYVSATQVYGAVWNDYAEFRKTNNEAKPGNIVIDNDDGSLTLSYARLLPGAQVVSDTYGFAIGETKETQTPLAVSGRVLVYTHQDRSKYHAGQAVCSAPNGTVDIMTRCEIVEYPDAIIGIVSEIPDYEEWGTGKVKIDGRIWIKVR